MVHKLALAVSLALGGISITAHGLGLGDINAGSVLNQNFNADIKLLSASEAELDNLKVRLASPEAFAKAGVDRPFYLSMLRFTPGEGSDGAFYVKVTSDFPIREPFLNFLIELNWPNGRLVREYTVLLDPPTTVRRAPPPIVAPVRQAEVTPSRPAAKPAPVRRAPAPTRAAPPRPAPAVVSATPGEYGPVRSGETAWRIAERLRPQGASVVQTMMALHRANPEAFINNNINKLRRGKILRVPSRDEIMEMSVAEARVAFKASQRDGLAQAPAPIPKKPEPAERVVPIVRDTETVAADTPGPAVVPEVEGGRLKIATARPQAEGQAGAEGDATQTPDVSAEIQQQLMIAQENAETSRQEAENLRDRVDDLELQLRDLQRLLTVKDGQFARIQAGMAEVDGVAGGLDTPDTPAGMEIAAAELEQTLAAAERSAESALELVTDGSEPSTEEPLPSDLEAAVEEALAATEADTGSEAAAAESSVESAAETPAEPAVEPPATVATPEPQPSVTEVAPVEPEPPSKPQAKAETQPFGMVWLQQNWPFVAGGVGGLAGLGILLGLLLGRRKESEVPDDTVTSNKVDEAELKAAADTDAGAEVDAAIAAVTQEYGDEAGASVGEEPLASATKSSASDVDPLSEADVYIAYGRYQQAEGLLKQATQREPQRLDLKLKLLEVYFATRNRSAYVALASRMADAGEDRIDVSSWDRVQDWGRELDPENSLFEASASRSGAFAAASGMMAAGVAAASSVDDDDLSLDDLEISELASDLNAETDIDDDIGADELDMALDLDDVDSAEAPDQAGQFAESLDDLDSLELDLPELDKDEEESLQVAEDSDDEFTRRKDDQAEALDEFAEDEEEHSPQAVAVDEESILNIDTELDADELQAQLDELSDLSMLDTEMVNAPAAEETLDQPIDLEAALANLGGDSELLNESLDAHAEPDDVDEEDVETKLDLARAYKEMGDGEGARSLLAEVRQEGTEEQKTAAAKLLEEVEAEV